MNHKTDQICQRGHNAKPYRRSAQITRTSLWVLYGRSRVHVDGWRNTPISRSSNHLGGRPDKRKRQQTNPTCNKWKGIHATHHPSSCIWLCPPYLESTIHPYTPVGGNNMWHLTTTSSAVISNCIGSRERLTSPHNNHCRTQTSNSKGQLPPQYTATIRTSTASVLTPHQMAGHD